MYGIPTYNRGFIGFFLAAALLSIVFIQACDESFDPLKENERFIFSMFGFLDASADTNWIRIIPLRETIDDLPDFISEVTLQHLEAGEITVMNDSIFNFTGGRQAINYWTTINILPGNSYLLKAERPDGVVSSVVIEIPDDFPTPIILEDSVNKHGLDTVLIEGVQNLADVRTIWRVTENFSQRSPVFDFAHLQDTTLVTGTNWMLEMDTSDDFASLERIYKSEIFSIDELITITDKQVWVASAGPDWLYFPGIDENVITLPDGISNIDNGTGFVIGIVSKTVPLKSCFDDDDEEKVIPCELEKPLW